MPERTVVHCFTGTPEDAQACLALGCDISISGVVTFKNAELLREAVRVGAVGAAPRRDRQPVPRARAVSREGQRTGLRDGRGGVRRRTARRELRRGARGDQGEYGPTFPTAAGINTY